jgi:hypothetical protein
LKARVWLGLLPALVITAADLKDVIDVHVHAAPDVLPRSIDGLEAARLAHAAGLRAIVVKNHYEPTASWAYFAQKTNPGIRVFGGIALNRPVGGINPAAVSRMARLPGGFGKVVWMPTFDAENQVRFSKETRPFVAVSSGGRLRPEVLEVLDLVREHGLVLATGHSTPAETRMLIAEARKRGIDRILVTHAMLSPVNMTIDRMKEAAGMGAYIEFVYNGLIGPNRQFTIEQYAQAIRQIGPRHCIPSSDLGQANNPLPVDGLRSFLDSLRTQGFTEPEIRQMTVENPALLLGLK